MARTRNPGSPLPKSIEGRSPHYPALPGVDHGLEELAHRTADPAVTYDCRVRIGHPANEIADFATEYGSDLIPIATHGSTGLERLLIGSITEKVVRLASCPVLTAKTPAGAFPSRPAPEL